MPLPNDLQKEDIYWAVASKIPQSRGLKSSAAISVAAIKALCEATQTELDDAEIVSLSSQAQVAAGVSITGSIDDSCLSNQRLETYRCKFEDINEGVVMEGPGLNPDDWVVLIAARDSRKNRPQLEDFAPMFNEFEKALIALQQGEILNCLTINGRAMCMVTNDIQGRKISNDDSFARSSGMSGSGPAIIIIVPSILQSSKRIKSTLGRLMPEK